MRNKHLVAALAAIALLAAPAAFAQQDHRRDHRGQAHRAQTHRAHGNRTDGPRAHGQRAHGQRGAAPRTAHPRANRGGVRPGVRGHSERRGAAPFHAPPGSVARGGHVTGRAGTWSPHREERGGVLEHWRGGHWWHGDYGGRLGWWWIVGPDWTWYPTQVAPIPDPYTPPGMVSGYWYWCEAYRQYYPYVGACPEPWRPVQMP